MTRTKLKKYAIVTGYVEMPRTSYPIYGLTVYAENPTVASFLANLTKTTFYEIIELKNDIHVGYTVYEMN